MLNFPLTSRVFTRISGLVNKIDEFRRKRKEEKSKKAKVNLADKKEYSEERECDDMITSCICCFCCCCPFVATGYHVITLLIVCASVAIFPVTVIIDIATLPIRSCVDCLKYDIV